MLVCLLTETFSSKNNSHGGQVRIPLIQQAIARPLKYLLDILPARIHRTFIPRKLPGKQPPLKRGFGGRHILMRETQRGYCRCTPLE